MKNKSRSLTDEETFQFMLSQLEEVERNIRYQGEGHRSETSFFLSLLSALITIALGLMTFDISTEKRLITLTSSILFFILIFSLGFMLTLIMLVLKIESRIVTTEWIEKAVHLRRFFVELNLSSITKFYKLPYQIKDSPKYWPGSFFKHHPYFKISLILYIIINSIFIGAIAFSITYYLTKWHVYSILNFAVIGIGWIGIIWVSCREYLINIDKKKI